MTQKERIDELQARIDRIEHKLWPVQAKQHFAVTSMKDVDKAELEALTEEEAAWLKARKMPTDSRKEICFSMQQKIATEEDRRIIQQLRKKRNLHVTWHA